MAKDVEATWVSILSQYHQKDQNHHQEDCTGDEEKEEAVRGEEEGDRSGVKMLEELKDSSRYLVDVWTP